jgi:hypothetical protein
MPRSLVLSLVYNSLQESKDRISETDADAACTAWDKSTGKLDVIGATLKPTLKTYRLRENGFELLLPTT